MCVLTPSFAEDWKLSTPIRWHQIYQTCQPLAIKQWDKPRLPLKTDEEFIGLKAMRAEYQPVKYESYSAGALSHSEQCADTPSFRGSSVTGIIPGIPRSLQLPLHATDFCNHTQQYVLLLLSLSLLLLVTPSSMYSSSSHLYHHHFHCVLCFVVV